MLKTHVGGLIGHQLLHTLVNYGTPARLLNLSRSLAERTVRRTRVSAWPYRLVVDVTNACNLRCPHCPTGKQVQGRPKGFIDEQRFEQILDQLGGQALIIDLFNWGEPLLHRDLFRMIAMAEQRRICTRVHTNLNFPLSDEQLGQLIDSGLTYLSASLDGADQETYETYRRSGSLETALETAGRILRLRKERGRRKPYLTWQFLVFPHNRHQVETARTLAAEIGFDRFETRQGITGREQESGSGICDWLWTTAAIHWDGKVGPCCRQFMARDDFGEIGDGDFMSVWNNEKFRYARSLFSRRPLSHQQIICNHCQRVKQHREQ